MALFPSRLAAFALFSALCLATAPSGFAQAQPAASGSPVASTASDGSARSGDAAPSETSATVDAEAALDSIDAESAGIDAEHVLVRDLAAITATRALLERTQLVCSRASEVVAELQVLPVAADVDRAAAAQLVLEALMTSLRDSSDAISKLRAGLLDVRIPSAKATAAKIRTYVENQSVQQYRERFLSLLSEKEAQLVEYEQQTVTLARKKAEVDQLLQNLPIEIRLLVLLRESNSGDAEILTGLRGLNHSLSGLVDQARKIAAATMA